MTPSRILNCRPGYRITPGFRRDRGSLGGGVACAVRSQLQPFRLPDPPGSEMLLLRLAAVSVTVAVCYRPPDDDVSLVRLTEAISGLSGASGALLKITPI
ncbi:hypothetical protein FJT64_007134 [Amphibalanus amphitrite]|uniref:Uncharacterized protein n=1 Tax=Amphibalanus amphitrite TaxID=1232801 RepID=A0A6A4VMI3_AMPAM|nr:hypothetical protein FJT64_007134 [Amphibalanus amphitrite]